MYYEIFEIPPKMTEYEAAEMYPDKDIYMKFDIEYLKKLGDFEEPIGEVLAIKDFSIPEKEHRKLRDYVFSFDENKYHIVRVAGDNRYDSFNIITRIDK